MAAGCLPLGAPRESDIAMLRLCSPVLELDCYLLFDRLPWSNYFYVKNYGYVGPNFLLPRCCFLNGNAWVMILTNLNVATHHVVLWNPISTVICVLHSAIFLLKGKFTFVRPFPLLSLLPALWKCPFKAQLASRTLGLVLLGENLLFAFRGSRVLCEPWSERSR